MFQICIREVPGRVSNPHSLSTVPGRDSVPHSYGTWPRSLRTWPRCARGAMTRCRDDCPTHTAPPAPHAAPERVVQWSGDSRRGFESSPAAPHAPFLPGRVAPPVRVALWSGDS